MDSSVLVKLVRSAEISITGKRFCSSCQSMQSAALGKMTEGKKINRWQCFNCSSRVSKRLYEKRAKT